MARKKSTKVVKAKKVSVGKRSSKGFGGFTPFQLLIIGGVILVFIIFFII